MQESVVVNPQITENTNKELRFQAPTLEKLSSFIRFLRDMSQKTGIPLTPRV